MAVILVSSCLLGCACRYKGDDCKNERILALGKDHVLLAVCPEQMGGLETPRAPSEIVGDRVVSNTGRDVTDAYRKGAETALYLAQLNHEGIKRVEFIVNETDKYAIDLDDVYSIDERKEFEYRFPLQEGENKLEVTVYNESDVSETVRVMFNK